jgi:outer membrane receptor protein involved in Fe transport
MGLEPEKLWSAEAGVGYAFSGMGHVGVSGYYNEIRDVILEVQTDDPNPNPEIEFWNQNQNVGRAEVVGVELNSDVSPVDWLTVFFNYTYAYGDYDGRDLPQTLISRPTSHHGDSMPNIAAHKINTGFTYSLLKDLTLHMRANYVGDRENIASNPVDETDQYILYHANVRWENAFFRGFYLQCLVKNILDEEAFDPGIRTATGGYYPTQHPIEGRNMWFSAGYKF